ncbi:TetR/AcrR family transcriptional regulator [Kribbella solani]|uniref:TetR/AcrR family transcriptional regulator n=1 Tax=Kribbella solani TaxID=236067 RepID=UPI0029ADEB4D|nr:TetR/AcrR family transcriptional regulator [Kribbella solani]MDX3006288.1 TetR/AcrR family transcriptional regulator [Kribbella solani]
MARLSKQARREQLLDVAAELVRGKGADALTLVTLAEVAGVSRPIVYDHFGTRSGLLLALYRELDERHRAALTDALRSAEPGTIAEVMSTAYFACAIDMPEFTSLSAALKGDPELEAMQHELLAGYVTLMADALAPHSPLPKNVLRLRCRGVLGAAEAIAIELTHDRTTAAEATAALAALIRD